MQQEVRVWAQERDLFEVFSYTPQTGDQVDQRVVVKSLELHSVAIEGRAFFLQEFQTPIKGQ